MTAKTTKTARIRISIAIALSALAGISAVPAAAQAATSGQQKTLNVTMDTPWG